MKPVSCDYDTGRGLHDWESGETVRVCRSCSAALAFDAGKHMYLAGGRRLPAVSDVLRPLSAVVYRDAPQQAMDRAATIGSRVHEATMLADLGKPVPKEIAEGIAGYLFAYRKFNVEQKPQPEAIEHIVFDLEDGYAGTIDRVALLGGERWVLDIKTSSTLRPELYAVQLYAYARAALIADSARLGILHLTPSGRYDLVEITTPRERLEAVWTSLLSVASWLASHEQTATPS